MRQRPGVEHVEAGDERGRRAVHSLLLCGLHALRRVQDGRGGVSVWTPTMSTKTRTSPPQGNPALKRVLLFVGQSTESRADRQDAVDLQRVVQFEAVPVLVHLPTTTHILASVVVGNGSIISEITA